MLLLVPAGFALNSDPSPVLIYTRVIKVLEQSCCCI